MIAQHIRRGTLGAKTRRVTGKSPALRNCRPVTIVRWSDGTEQILAAQSRVPGVPPRTDIPAGPVSGKGPSLFAARLPRGTDESGRDYNSRVIANITG